MLCRPRTARLERVSTIEGVKTVEVVETCDCSTGHACRRELYSQALHVGTPYQVEIDVGACVGSCRSMYTPTRNSLFIYGVVNKHCILYWLFFIFISFSEYGCRPSKNTTISVRGPNGIVIVVVWKFKNFNGFENILFLCTTSGAEVYQVIEKCRCAGICHRMDHMETILDFSGIGVKENMRIADVKPVVKVGIATTL